MKFVFNLIAIAVCVALTACASFPPSASDLAGAQQLRFGQALPKEGNYVLLYPAGTPLPVAVVVGGNLFEQEQQAVMQVVLKRDIYTYGQFASYDRVHWSRGFEFIKAEIKLEIPQKDGANAGMLRFDMNQR